MPDGKEFNKNDPATGYVRRPTVVSWKVAQAIVVTMMSEVGKWQR